MDLLVPYVRTCVLYVHKGPTLYVLIIICGHPDKYVRSLVVSDFPLELCMMVIMCHSFHAEYAAQDVYFLFSVGGNSQHNFSGGSRHRFSFCHQGMYLHMYVHVCMCLGDPHVRTYAKLHDVRRSDRKLSDDRTGVDR